MLITIAQARQIMGDANSKYSDQQMEEILNVLYALCNLIIDEYIRTKKEVSCEHI